MVCVPSDSVPRCKVRVPCWRRLATVVPSTATVTRGVLTGSAVYTRTCGSLTVAVPSLVTVSAGACVSTVSVRLTVVTLPALSVAWMGTPRRPSFSVSEMR